MEKEGNIPKQRKFNYYSLHPKIKETKMSTKIIHLSDLHIGNWLEFPQKTIEEDNLKKLVKHIKKSYKGNPKPLILITGDLTHDGESKQYEQAKILLKPLIEAGFIVWPIPGNHDYGRL